MTHTDPLNRTDSQKFQFLKSKVADSSHVGKTVNCHNAARVRHIAMKFGMITHYDILNAIG